MDLYNILKINYPDADFTQDIILQDDGNGVYIKEFNLGDIPNDDDLKLLEQEYITIVANQQREELRQELISKLDEIDLKSIRALRTNDVDRLNALEQEAVVIRDQLKTLV